MKKAIIWVSILVCTVIVVLMILSRDLDFAFKGGKIALSALGILHKINKE